MTMSQVGVGGCCDHVPGGGQCCDHVPDGGEGGRCCVTMFPMGGEGGDGCCDHVPSGGGRVL